MKYKSSVYTQASGSVGGLTYSHNGAGLYTRARAIPTNPNTPQQAAVRATFSQLSANWSQVLTQAQRDAWISYALATPLTNTLGDPIFVSGLAMYQRGNIGRIQAGLARIDDGPTTAGLPEFTAPGITGVTASTSALVLTFTASDTWVNTNGSALLAYGSRGQSPGINFFKGPYRFANSVDGDATTPPTSPANITLPFTYAAGQRVFLRFAVVDAEGRLSSAFRDFIAAS